jgi:cobalamin synthase
VWLSALAVGGVILAVLDPRSAVPALAGYAVALGSSVWWRRRFGELTGDGIGACGVVAETAALLALAAALRSA